MKPYEFPEANRTLAKPQGMTDEECSSLWVYTDGEDCISLWRPTLKERLSILLFGRVWLFVHSGHTQPPVALMAQRKLFGAGGHKVGFKRAVELVRARLFRPQEKPSPFPEPDAKPDQVFRIG